ncbi:MAG: amidohydrolase family protein [Bacteroidales bacterium]
MMKRADFYHIICKPSILFILIVLFSCQTEQSYYTASDFEKVPKIDAHFHYLTKDTSYINFAKSINFKLITPIWEGEEVPIDSQFVFSSFIKRKYPNDYAFFAAFHTDSINSPEFAEKTINHIKELIKNGARGIKIWKNIGMVIKYPDGKYIMIDDPVFEPVFQFLEKEKIPVIAHLGEPKNCWLPLDQMTDRGDSSYYSNNPQFHMFKHPEVPNYDLQIQSRDNILKKYPNLDFTGAHLGSLEWSVDELAKRLDAYPNFRVDMAARLGHLQNQSRVEREKVRNFMIKYQDRIEYATDSEVYDEPGLNPQTKTENLLRGWKAQWIYLTTDSIVDNTMGLKLPKEVIDKIYFKNASRYF